MTRKILFACVSAVAIMASVPTAQAQESSDIIVTARRSEERLQDVPISITVFSQEQLANRNIVSTADLGTYTPSLSVNSRFGPEKASFAIRGFIQESNTAPSVGVYFAEVVALRAAGGTTSGNGVGVGGMFDLQNVQVLKGPQGTLFGRNTTGGAVLLSPRKPTGNLEGYVEASAGDYNLRRVQAAVNVPILDTLRVRAAFDRQTRDGFLANHSGVGPRDFGDVDYWAARVSVVADLSPNLENYFIGSYSNSNTNGHLSRVTLCNRAAAATAANPPAGVTPSHAQQLARMACAQIDRQDARGDGPWDVENGHPNPFLKLRQWQLINTTTWKASDSLTVKNIVSYGEFTERAAFSLNGNNFTLLPGQPLAGQVYQYLHLYPAPGADNASQSTFTEELQFQGQLGGLDWQAGGYLELSEPLGDSSGNTISFVCSDLSRLQCSAPFGTSSTSSFPNVRTRFNNKGFYAQGTYHITEQLSATAGIRYTIDKMTVRSQNMRIRFPTPNVPQYVCNDSLRFQGPGATPLVVQDASQCLNIFSTESEKLTWLLGLDYKPSEDIMLYGKYARGYRAGGIATTNVGLETWKPEKVETYEIGAKASFRGAVRGYFNIAGFYNDFSNQQVTATLTGKAGSGLTGISAIINAGKSEIKGVEVEASATAFGALKFDVGYTWLDAKLKSIVVPALDPAGPFATIAATSRPGETLALSPRNRFTGTVTLTIPVDPAIGKIAVGGTYVYTSSQIANLISPLGILPATNLFNLNANWDKIMGGPVDAAFFMTNVTNQYFPLNVGNGFTSAGFESLIANQPRMWGVRLRYNFGG